MRGSRLSVVEEFPLLRCRLVALFALRYLDFAFALVYFSSSGVWVLPVECVVLVFRDACAAWFNSGYMFCGRLWTNFTIFYVAVYSNPEASGLHSFELRKCAQSMLLVAVSSARFSISAPFSAVCGGFCCSVQLSPR